MVSVRERCSRRASRRRGGGARRGPVLGAGGRLPALGRHPARRTAPHVLPVAARRSPSSSARCPRRSPRSAAASSPRAAAGWCCTCPRTRGEVDVTNDRRGARTGGHPVQRRRGRPGGPGVGRLDAHRRDRPARRAVPARPRRRADHGRQGRDDLQRDRLVARTARGCTTSTRRRAGSTCSTTTRRPARRSSVASSPTCPPSAGVPDGADRGRRRLRLGGHARRQRAAAPHAGRRTRRRSRAAGVACRPAAPSAARA